MQGLARTQRGFTLIELITVIIILGVVSVGISGFIRTGLGIYTDVTEREQLLSESRFVVERLNRELRGAVPNSVRIATNDTNTIQCIEFVPAQWVTFYISLPVLPEASVTMVTPQIADNSAGYTYAVGDSAIVYPTKMADVYDLTNNKRQITTVCRDDILGDCTDKNNPGQKAKFNLSGAFADYSPASRVYFANQSVSYCAHSSGDIYRIEVDSINTSQTPYDSSLGTLMAENLSNDLDIASEMPFRVSDASLTRNSLVHILLTFERNEEVVNFSSEVHIPNVP